MEFIFYCNIRDESIIYKSLIDRIILYSASPAMHSNLRLKIFLIEMIKVSLRNQC